MKKVHGFCWHVIWNNTTFFPYNNQEDDDDNVYYSFECNGDEERLDVHRLQGDDGRPDRVAFIDCSVMSSSRRGDGPLKPGRIRGPLIGSQRRLFRPCNGVIIQKVLIKKRGVRRTPFHNRFIRCQRALDTNRFQLVDPFFQPLHSIDAISNCL